MSCPPNGKCQQGRCNCNCRDLPNPTGPLSPPQADGASVALALAATLVVWLVAVVIAPFLAGWWHS